MTPPPTFTSVDWGTTNLRVRRIENGNVADETTSDQGISRLGPTPDFAETLRAAMDQIGAEPPVVISGMASSRTGWRELPYAPIPFPLNGSATVTTEIAPGIHLISGVRSATDVMRGEETELLGLDSLPPEAIVLLPGTHSKHCRIENGTLTNFSTHLTGELRALLRHHSTLSSCVTDDWDESAFTSGVALGSTTPLTQALFQVRTRHLLNNPPPSGNGTFLDGILIGAELASLPNDLPIILAAAGPLHAPYVLAAQALSLTSQITTLPPETVATLAVRGQQKILHRILNQ